MSNTPAAAPSPVPTAAPAAASTRVKYVIKATGEEAKNFDFTSARGDIKTTNFIGTVANLIKSCLGGGIVAIHEAYMKGGLFTSLVMNIVIGMLLIHNKYILVTSAQIMYGRLKVGSLTYPDLAEAVVQTSPFPKLHKFSSVFRYIVDAMICTNLFGACTCYTVVIANSVKQVLEEAKLVEVMNVRIYVVCMLVPCILIAMIVALKYLAPFSILGNIILLSVAVATIYYGSQAATKSVMEVPSFKSAQGFFEFLGICVLSMEGMGQIIALENHMRDPKKFPMALCMGMSTVVGLVMTIGFFGYWGFGEAARSPVTLNFPWEPVPIALKCCLAVVMYITFGLNLWSPFNVVWFYIKRRHNPEKYWCVERVYRAIIVCILTCLAVAFPNVSAFLGFLGSFCISVIGFLYPAFIELVVKWEDPGLGPGNWRLYKFGINFLFGIMVCILGSYVSLKSLLTTKV